jgi:hypothetical protein
MMVNSLISISWSIHLRPQVLRLSHAGNTAATVWQLSAAAAPALAAASAAFSAAGSVRSLNEAVNRSWLVCFLHCGSNLRPPCCHWWSLLSCLDACGCALAGPSYCYQVVRCHCALAYRLHSAEHSPSSSVLSLSPPNQDLYISMHQSVEKSAHLLGTENQARLSLGQRWGDCGPHFLHCLTHR